MFKKLRNKFLILNLIIISVMMLLSFGSIYLIIYQNVRSTIYEELADASEFYGKMDGNFNAQDLILKSPHRKKKIG